MPSIGRHWVLCPAKVKDQCPLKPDAKQEKKRSGKIALYYYLVIYSLQYHSRPLDESNAYGLELQATVIDCFERFLAEEEKHHVSCCCCVVSTEFVSWQKI